MSNQEFAEDEINLCDYIRVILKRKGFILTLFFVSVITTAIVSFCMPKVYETTSLIQLGSINEMLIKKEEVKEMLLNQNFLKSNIEKLNFDIKLGKLKKNIHIEDIKNTNLLGITVHYHDVNMIVKLHETIENKIISKGKDIYRRRISLINERLEELNNQIQKVEQDAKRTQNLITKLPESGGIYPEGMSLRIILLQNILPNYESHLKALMDHRNDIKILCDKAKDFEIIEQPIKPQYPIKPNKKLNILVSSIVSLMAGIFLSFFIEHWQSPKPR